MLDEECWVTASPHETSAGIRHIRAAIVMIRRTRWVRRGGGTGAARRCLGAGRW